VCGNVGLLLYAYDVCRTLNARRKSSRVVAYIHYDIVRVHCARLLEALHIIPSVCLYCVSSPRVLHNIVVRWENVLFETANLLRRCPLLPPQTRYNRRRPSARSSLRPANVFCHCTTFKYCIVFFLFFFTQPIL